MGRLIKAEFRKIFSTHLWWVLLVCTAVLGLLWSWVFGEAGSFLSGELAKDPLAQQAGADALPFSVFGFARAVNITAVFPMIVGALAVSGENYRKTITTSFLVAPSRGTLLAAKVAVYAALGVGYGVLISGVASIGMLLSTSSAGLPSASGWLSLFGSGVLSTVLWTLLGVGVGALFGNVIASLLGLLGYTVILENSLLLVLPSGVSSFLPNNAADSITSSIAAQYVFDNSGALGKRLELDSTLNPVVHGFAGAAGDLGWLFSVLVFAGYTALFIGGGWLITKYRDVS